RQWAACLEQPAEAWAKRLRRCANLVAATRTSLAGDEQFGDAAPEPIQFDLLVLDEAHRVTESEFVAAARWARRWVLVGEPMWESERVRECERQPVSGRLRPHPLTLPHSHALRPGFFQSLWQHLHFDLWARED